MLFCNSGAEGGYEGAFQITDNVTRLTESGISLEDWSNFNTQLTAPETSPSLNQFNQFTITPDGINFMPPAGSDAALNPGLQNALMPGGDMSALLGSMSALPGGMGVVASFFQALFSFVSGALTSTATDMAKNYAMAAQVTAEGSKSLIQ